MPRPPHLSRPLVRGALFASKKAAEMRVATLFNEFGKGTKVSKSDRTRMSVRCANRQCPAHATFYLRDREHKDVESVPAELEHLDVFWVMRSINANHTCDVSKRLRNHSVQAIATVVPIIGQAAIAAGRKGGVHTTIVNVVQASATPFKVSDRAARNQAYRLRRDTPDHFYTSLQHLEDFINRLSAHDPEGVYSVDVKARRRSIKMPGGTTRCVRELAYVIFAFSFSVRVASRCRPVIVADATHMSDRLGASTLYLLATKDANDHLVPMAYMMAWGAENKHAWRHFFTAFRPKLEWAKVLISDRRTSLIEAAREVLPFLRHTHCTKHLFDNVRVDKNHWDESLEQELARGLKFRGNAPPGRKDIGEVQDYNTDADNEVMKHATDDNYFEKRPVAAQHGGALGEQLGEAQEVPAVMEAI